MNYMVVLGILIFSPFIKLYAEQKSPAPSPATEKQETKQEDPSAWRKKVFTYIYEKKHWDPIEKPESVSGPGSRIGTTQEMRSLLPGIMKALNIRSLLDAGCGDFNWMKEIDLDLELYLGADIVPALIEKNQELYGNEKRCFLTIDITSDYIPPVDAILCRDCLAHMSYEDIRLALINFKRSGAQYLIASSFVFLQKPYGNIKTGNFRKVNFSLPPFNFPAPIMYFQELSAEPESKSMGKSMCVWRLADIKID